MKFFVLTIVLFIISFDAISQVFFELPDSVIDLPIFSFDKEYDCTYWFDYDNDNDLDLFITLHGFGVFFNNHSGVYFTRQDSFIINSYSSRGFDFKDFDNDGDIDILHNDTIFENTIMLNSKFTKITDSCYYSNFDMIYQWGDLFNRGYIGVFGFFNTHFVFSNSNLPDSCGYTFNSVAPYGNLYDFNNDGYIDIFRIFNNHSSLCINNGFSANQKINCTNNPFSYYILNSFVVFDINNDGYLDFSVSGNNLFYFENAIYLNNQNMSFSKLNNTGIPDSLNIYQYLFDSNNDGKVDVLTMDYGAKVYQQDSNLTFNLSNTFNTAERAKYSITGDYDNDGDLDLLLIGTRNIQPSSFTALYRNDSTPPNTPPTAPQTLWTTMDSTKVIFHWNRATDVETPQITLSYNLMVGTSSKIIDITSPMADTVTGFRRVVELGNAQLNNFYILDKSIFNIGDTVYWSVQTIDNGFGYSPFSKESSAIIIGRMEAPIFDTLCGGDSVLWRGSYYKNSGKYNDTYGLDSAFALNLKVHPSYLDKQEADICSGSPFTWNGNTYYNSGTYDIQHYTTKGCDSIERLVLNVHPGLTVLQNEDICLGDSLLFGGSYLKTSGVFWDSLQSVYSCDSIIQLTLNVSPSDSSVWQSGDTLFTTAQNATYRWWNCDKQEFVYAANNSWFLPYQNGHYAVEISSNGCSYLTSCLEVTGLSIDNTGIHDLEVNLMPNPNDGKFYLELKAQGKQEYQILIFDALGKKVYNQQIEFENHSKIEIDLRINPAGVYQLQLISEDGIISRKVVLR